MPSTISAGTTAGTAIAIAGDTTGNLAFQTNGTTTAMTITTAQNVGVGTTSPGALLSTRNGYVRVQAANQTVGDFSQRVGFEWTQETDIQVAKIEVSRPSWGNAPSDMVFFTRRASDGAVTEQTRITESGLFQMNSGYGSVATAYGCRAWVNFVGSSGAINSSGGVSSVTRNGTGDYSVNFSFTFPDANYAGTGMGRRNSSAQRAVLMVMNNTATYNQFTTYARFYTMLNDSATVEDPIFFNYTAVR